MRSLSLARSLGGVQTAALLLFHLLAAMGNMLLLLLSHLSQVNSDLNVAHRSETLSQSTSAVHSITTQIWLPPSENQNSN